MKHAVITALCVVLFSSFASGCLWIAAGAVGVAVVTANIDEYQNSGSNSTGTEALDEYLADEKAVDDALAGAKSEKIEVKKNVTISDIINKNDSERITN
ncbi:hypothetical protein [Desulfovibrio sp. UCD-KL4C]|uniref:hypothetical protein n=1 Tax=Desulfovibrio sp. UCD-KL4C TaxID=2578120 RepID=UPI0025B8B8A1|nr:hypothetical protein [Desulfovibrio sp. UCD-KL4C]